MRIIPHGILLYIQEFFYNDHYLFKALSVDTFTSELSGIKGFPFTFPSISYFVMLIDLSIFKAVYIQFFSLVFGSSNGIRHSYF